MLKKRVIVLLTLQNGRLMRTKNFRPDRWYTLDFVDLAAFDEAVCINLTPDDKSSFVQAVNKVSDTAAIPITVGGGISSMDDISWAMGEMPTEKVVIETHGELIDEGAGKWGSQAMVWGCTAGREGTCPNMEGVGEIFLQSVGRDGSLEGYDLDLPRNLEDVTTPIIIGSGCGTWKHMIEGFEAGADGCATSCIFHMNRNAVDGFKLNLSRQGVPVRI